MTLPDIAGETYSDNEHASDRHPACRLQLTRRTNIMAVGDTYGIGTSAPATGRYKCSGCANTIIVNKGETLPPCSGCNTAGVKWTLVAILT